MPGVRSLTADRAEEVRDLFRAVTAHDGVAPLDEAALFALQGSTASSPRPSGDEGPGPVHVLRREGSGTAGELLAYAGMLADGTVQGMVRPGARRRGLGTALWQDVRTIARDAGRDPAVWAHGGLAASVRFLEGVGLVPVRTLLVLGRDLVDPVPQRDARGADLEISTFEAERDAEDWLEVNAAAFAGHPEQGRITREDLEARMAEPWFDASAFHLARRDGDLVAFVWMKPDVAAAATEVYVVGTAPSAQGTGIAGLLLTRALEQARRQGARHVELFVEGDNAGALALYRRLGFVETARHLQFREA